MGLRESLKAHLPPAARILVIDIETRPLVVYSWGLWDQNHGIHQIIDEGGTMCFAAKWYGDHPRKMTFRSEHEHGHDEMISEAWDLLDKADIVIGYNHDRFDIPELSRQFVVAGMPPPSPHKSIDLLKVARRRFRFPSNKLDWVSRELGIGQKVEHEGWKLWERCLAGDDVAHRKMAKYCKGDVLLTETAYDRLRAWVPNHPNVNMYRAEKVSGCAACGSDELEEAGFHYTQTRAYKRWRCRCGFLTRATTHEPEMAQHRRSAG